MNLAAAGTIRSTSGVALLAGMLLAGCDGGNAAAPAPQPPEVAVVTVQRAAVPVTTELPGRTSAFLVAQVRARVDGIVLKRAFKEGADVTANQPLYQIDPAPYRAALDSARRRSRDASERRGHDRTGGPLQGPGRRQRGQQTGIRQRGRPQGRPRRMSRPARRR